MKAQAIADARPALRWGICLCVVLLVHGGGLVMVRRMTAQAAVSEPAMPFMLELAPAPQAPPDPIPPDATPPEPVPAPPTPPPPAVETPVVETPPPVVPQPAPPPTPDVAVPEPPVTVPAPDLVLPRPLPKPVHKPSPPPPILRPVARPPTPPVPTPAPVATPHPAMPPAAAPSQQIAATWQSMLVAHITRFKRYPVAALRRGDQGVAYVRFVMDREGEVLSAVLERSSGHPELDREATAWLTRARPLPKPPAEIARDRMELVLPMRFELH